MEIRRLSRMPYAQAKIVISENGTITLISYTTVVAEISEDNWLTIFGLYSATTRKHISAFMREYAELSYQVARQIYEDGYKLNIMTGEVVEI